MVKRKFYIETYGCQMNIYDSGVIAEMLTGEGHVPADSAGDADLILINTCSVRDRAERKVLSRLQELSSVRRERPGLLVGVVGCMAKRLGARLTRQAAGADLVVGPDSYRELPRMVSALGEDRVPVVETAEDQSCTYTYRPAAHAGVTAGPVVSAA